MHQGSSFPTSLLLHVISCLFYFFIANLMGVKWYLSFFICIFLIICLVAQRLKRLSAMRETRVQSLGWEDPLEKEMATYSSTLAWRIPWTEEPGRLQSVGLLRVGHNWATSLSLYTLTVLQYILLEGYTCNSETASSCLRGGDLGGWQAGGAKRLH